MKENLLKKTVTAGARVANIGVEAERIRHAVADRVEDGLDQARRKARQGYHAAEDFADDAVYCVKRNPVASVGVAFGSGLVLGALLMRLLRR